LVARFVRIEEVRGSIPRSSTKEVPEASFSGLGDFFD